MTAAPEQKHPWTVPAVPSGERQVSNVIHINVMENLAFETVSAHPSFCHAFSRMSLRFCRFLCMESLMSRDAKKRKRTISHGYCHIWCTW